MIDTETYAERQVAGGKLYLFKAPTAKKWRIRFWWRDLYVEPSFAPNFAGILRSAQWADERYLRMTFATPDDAAATVSRALAA